MRHRSSVALHNTDNRKVKRGFSLLEFLVIVVIIAMLTAILLPVFGRARRAARATTCLSNLRQIGQAVHAYQSDNESQLPIENPVWTFEGDDDPKPATLSDPLKSYGTTEAIYHCPEAADGPTDTASRHLPRFPLYNVRFVIDMQIPMPSKRNPGAFYHDSTTWHLTPEPSTVLVYCSQHMDDTSAMPPHGLPFASGDAQHGWRFAQKGFFQALRADGSASRIPTGEVDDKPIDYPPFDKGYDSDENVYYRFPNEPWPLKMTKIGEMHYDPAIN